MTYLLDTHTFLWALIDPDKLSEKVRSIIEIPENRVLVSVISFWEISLKYALGKLELQHLLPEELPTFCKKMRLDILPLNAAECATYHQLIKTTHKDPFDRMLIWQAKHSGIPILCKDDQIKQYESEGITVIW